MRILFTIIACFSLTAVFAQKQKLIAAGSSTNLYINHKVSSKETYDAVGHRYNISSQRIADYNNLDYHAGKLLAKYLKVPLGGKNFVSASAVPAPNGLTPVYKKSAKGKLGILGYLNRGEIGNITERNNEVPGTVAAQTKTENDSVPSSATAPVADAAAKTTAPQTEAIKKVRKPSPDFEIDETKTHRRGFFRPKDYIREFFSTAVTLTLITFFLICLIYFYLSVKKKLFLSRQQLKTHVVRLISNAILIEEADIDNNHLNLEMPRLLAKQFHVKHVRQLVIDELIVAKKSLRGQAASNLIILYEYLGLLKDSLEKLDSNKWYIKAKGIEELAMMDQKKFLLQIFRHTNSKNEFVRMEAQSAVVHFGGFKGLRFLHVLTYPISDWQQIKLIDQLSLLAEKELPNANKLLQSKNDSVVIFTLKIISVFHNLALHDDVVLCLNHENAAVRHHAIKCLTNIYDDTTASVLQNAYEAEELRNKVAILHALKKVGSSEQADFLYLELFNDDDTIKLAAASSLMECCPDALSLIGDVSLQKGYPYTNILHHIKEGLPA